MDDRKANAIVEEMERLVMREVPYVKIGEYFGLRGVPEGGPGVREPRALLLLELLARLTTTGAMADGRRPVISDRVTIGHRGPGHRSLS